MAITHIGSTVGSGATSVSCAIPSGHQAGDLLIFAVGTDYWDEYGATVPAGWSVLQAEIFDSSLSHFLTIFYKWATGLDVAPTSNAANTHYMIGNISCWRGVEQTDFINAIAHSAQTNSSQILSFPGVTTTVTNAMIVHIACVFGNGTRTGWANANLTGLTEAVDAQDYTMAYGTKVTAGATGTTTANNSNYPYGVMVTIALKPSINISSNFLIFF